MSYKASAFMNKVARAIRFKGSEMFRLRLNSFKMLQNLIFFVGKFSINSSTICFTFSPDTGKRSEVKAQELLIVEEMSIKVFLKRRDQRRLHNY